MRFRIHRYVAPLKSEVFNLREEPKVANFVPFLFCHTDTTKMFIPNLTISWRSLKNCINFNIIQRRILILKCQRIITGASFCWKSFLKMDSAAFFGSFLVFNRLCPFSTRYINPLCRSKIHYSKYVFFLWTSLDLKYKQDLKWLQLGYRLCLHDFRDDY